MWVGLISSLIDVVLNYVLVPQIGIKGAAISTIVSLAFISLSYLFMVYPMILKALSITSPYSSAALALDFSNPLAIAAAVMLLARAS